MIATTCYFHFKNNTILYAIKEEASEDLSNKKNDIHPSASSLIKKGSSEVRENKELQKNTSDEVVKNIETIDDRQREVALREIGKLAELENATPDDNTDNQYDENDLNDEARNPTSE